MARPVVSVLTPTFNHARYLRECIESVQSQTFPQWELIVLDDGSEDDTCRIALDFSKHDPRIKVESRIHQGPGRLGELYNLGLQQASGEFIAILEGDDFWPPEKLAVQLEAFPPNTGLSFGNCTVVNPQGKRVHTLVPGKRRSSAVVNNSSRGEALAALIRQDNFVPAVTAMVRKDALRAISGFRTAPGMMQVDFSTWCHLSLTCDFHYVDANLGFWRRHEDSISVTRMHDLVKAKNEFLIAFLAELKNSHPEIIQKLGLPQDEAALATLALPNPLLAEALHRLAARDLIGAVRLFVKCGMNSDSRSHVLKAAAGYLSRRIRASCS